MGTKKADPKMSEGARLERKAFREYLRRAAKPDVLYISIDRAMKWVLAREKRYSKKPGGL